MQAEIDLQAGFINAEEGDYTTAYSYFFEGYEAAESDRAATRSLQLMLLCRIMAGKAGGCGGGERRG